VGQSDPTITDHDLRFARNTVIDCVDDQPSGGTDGRYCTKEQASHQGSDNNAADTNGMKPFGHHAS
jgi:hypothetical protein